MILASQSPRRIELMSEAGYSCRVVPADIDESPLSRETPIQMVERLARAKAEFVANTAAEPGEVVLAADTIVAADSKKLGKPADEDDARSMLAALSGRTHQVATGVCLVKGSDVRSFVETTEVEFFELEQAEIDAYVKTGEPLDKAGAYGIQGAGGRLLVRGIRGDYYNVVGLPIAHVVRELKKLGEFPRDAQ